MAGRAGGEAAKIGIIYEANYTVKFAVARLISGQATELVVEPPGDAGEGIEYRLDLADGTREVVQCKASQKVWTASELRTPLAALMPHLSDPDTSVAFATVSGTVLDALSRRFVNRGSYSQAWLQSLGRGEEKLFIDLTERLWSNDRLRAFDQLSRIRFDVFGLATLEREAIREVNAALGCDGGIGAVASLAYLTLTRTGRPIRREEVVAFLEECGVAQPLKPHATVKAALGEVRDDVAKMLTHVDLLDADGSGSLKRSVSDLAKHLQGLAEVRQFSEVGALAQLAAAVRDCADERWKWAETQADRIENRMRDHKTNGLSLRPDADINQELWYYHNLSNMAADVRRLASNSRDCVASMLAK